MESSAAFDGAVYGEEEAITVEIVQEAVETSNDESNIVILQSMDGDHVDSQAVEMQESDETGASFENMIDIEQQEQQFVGVPLTIASADDVEIGQPQFVHVPLESGVVDTAQHDPGVHEIVQLSDSQVAYSDHQHLVQSLQSVQSSGLGGQDLQNSNIIILQPIDSEGESVITTSANDFDTDDQTYIQAIAHNEQQHLPAGTQIVEIPEDQQLQYVQEEEEEESEDGYQYIQIQGPGSGDAPQYIRIERPPGRNSQIQYVQVHTGADGETQQIQYVDNQHGFIKIGDSTEDEQPQYVELQPVPTIDQLDQENSNEEGEDVAADIAELKSVSGQTSTVTVHVTNSKVGSQKIPEFPESQADEDDDFNDDDELQPQTFNLNSTDDNIHAIVNTPIKTEPRGHIIEVFKSYDAVLTRISEIEIDTNSKFVREKKNSKIFGQEWIKRPVRNEREFSWCSKNTGQGGERERLSPEIEFDGIPFINVGYIRLDCNLGMQDVRQVKKLTEERKRKPYASKKIGCPAKIYVSQVTKFPDYKILEDTKRNRQMLLQQLTVDLKYDWENVKTESWYYCRFPSENDHRGHVTRGEGAGDHLPMDHRIKDKVKEWTCQGINSCSQMKSLIDQYVTEHLFPGQLVPQTRRFYPRTKEICNVMYCAKVQQLPPQLDLDKIDTVVKEHLTNINPGDSLHYRPSYPKGHHFIFVYQSEWQKHLLSHYGRELVFVEPIFKHTQYSLPIYCLVVRTNIGFTVAGMFSLKLVTKPLLGEVFKYIAEWNPDWKPRHLLADFSDENISGILENFADTVVLLTDSYMEESWRKWIDRKDSGVAKETESLISMLKAVARAQSQSDFEVALETFVNSPRYLSVVRLRRWFLAKWLPVCERWADVYKDDALRLIRYGNRGRERMSELIAYICSCFDTMREAPLSKVLRYIVTVIMPELFADYSRANVQMLSEKATREELPEFLRNRPSEFINHILDRSDPCAFDEGVNIQELGMGSFKVNNHDVDFTRPYCSCSDWQKHTLPCKHFCVIFNHMPGWSWENLVQAYRESPLFKADPFCPEANKKMQERAEIKFEAIEQEDLNEVEPSALGDDDLADALTTFNENSQDSNENSQDSIPEMSQQTSVKSTTVSSVPKTAAKTAQSEKSDLALNIQSQFRALTDAVKQRKDSAGLLRIINDKLNSVLNVLKSPSKSSNASVPNSPARLSDFNSEPNTPVVCKLKSDQWEKGGKFIYQIKTEKEAEKTSDDDSSDIYDPPPIYVPTNFRVSSTPNKQPTRISIPFDGPKIVTPSPSLAKGSNNDQPKMLLKPVQRKPSDQPTKIYVPFKSPKVLGGNLMPLTASSVKRIDFNSPLMRTATPEAKKAENKPVATVSAVTAEKPASISSNKSSSDSPPKQPTSKSDSTLKPTPPKPSTSTPTTGKRGRPKKIVSDNSATPKTLNSTKPRTHSNIFEEFLSTKSKYDDDPDFDLSSEMKVVNHKARKIKKRKVSISDEEEESDFDEDEKIPKPKSKAPVRKKSKSDDLSGDEMPTPVRKRGRPKKQVEDVIDDENIEITKSAKNSTGENAESNTEHTESKKTEAKSEKTDKTEKQEKTPTTKKRGRPAGSTSAKKPKVEMTPKTPVHKPVFVNDDPNVRKSSRKSTSIYAGNERIKPSSRDLDFDSPVRLQV